MKLRSVRSLVWASLCFIVVTSVFFCIYIARLFASGFPPLDVQLDRERFVSHVFPIAWLCATVVFFGRLSSRAERFGDIVRGVIAIGIPVVIAVSVFDRMSSGIAVSNATRTLFGCSCAFIFFIAIAYMPTISYRRTIKHGRDEENR